MRAQITTVMALAALAGLCLAAPVNALADTPEKYFQNSRERLTALSASAGNLFNDTQNPAEKIAANYLTMVGGLRAASADLITQLLEINANLRDPEDLAYVQAKIATLRQDLPSVIKTDIKYLTEIAGVNKNPDLAKLADEIAKELKVLLNNLENLSFSQP